VDEVAQGGRANDENSCGHGQGLVQGAALDPMRADTDQRSRNFTSTMAIAAHAQRILCRAVPGKLGQNTKSGL